jgi:ubiquinone/menaquinone biosynthesis C-methylase UbiE
VAKLFLSLLRSFFYLLYHPFAWTYDLVSWTVSLGHWKSWGRSSIPYLEGTILEVGYGPGHLQQALNEKGMQVFGLDESRQMARQARRRLRKQGYPNHLSRGRAEYLPFPGGAFNSVVATFPSEYIFDRRTLNEIHRVLTPCGKLVILPTAWITGTRPLERLAAWLFRVTGEAPGKPKLLRQEVQEQFQRAGFLARSEIIQLEGSQVLVIIAALTSVR